MQRQDFRFAERLRVRWAEIDAQKIVFNGHYLMYVDTAVAGYWRQLAMPYAETMASLSGDLYVKKATLEYHASARNDEHLEIGIRCQRIGTSSMLFAAGVFRGETLLVSAEIVYVFADPVTQTSRPVPPVLRSTLEGFEAGESVLQVKTGSWADMAAHARPIRDQVFTQEQGIAAELEFDDDDATALHAVAINRFGLAVATGRLLARGAAGASAQASSGVGRVGRMAVLPMIRGSGVGTQILEALAEAARARGDQRLVLNAQVSAEAFYRRLGFEPEGDVFQEAGIRHRMMARAL